MKPNEINELLAELLQALWLAIYGMCLLPSQIRVAIRSAPWLGLGETRGMTAAGILEVLGLIDAAEPTADQVATDMTNAADLAHAKEHDVRRKLVKASPLLPHLLALATVKKWDYKAILVNRNQSFPSIDCKSGMTDVTVPKMYKDPRVDLAVEAQLGQRLNHPGNVTDWRCYTSVLGLFLFASLPKEQREKILAGNVVPGYAFMRYTLEIGGRQTGQGQARLTADTKAMSPKPAKMMEAA